MKNAAQFLEDITANVDAWYADGIDYETFSARQRVTWDAIEDAGPAIKARVLKALRDRLPPADRALRRRSP